MIMTRQGKPVAALVGAEDLAALERLMAAGPDQRHHSNDLPLAERYRLPTTREVMVLVGVRSRQSVWRYVKQGKLPRPRYLGPRRPLWRLGEILDSLDQCISDEI